MLQCVAVYCNVLQCVAVCGSVWQCVAVCGSVLQCVAVCCSVLQCVAVCCSVLQYVAVCCICVAAEMLVLKRRKESLLEYELRCVVVVLQLCCSELQMLHLSFSVLQMCVAQLLVLKCEENRIFIREFR